MADEDMQGIRVGVNDEEKRKTEKGVTGMNKVACPLFYLFTCYFLLGIPFNGGADMKGSSHNRLNNIFFLSKSSQLVGDCNSDPGSLRFWSLKDGHLNKVVQLDDNEFFSSIAISPDESLIAVGIFKVKPYETRYDTSERAVGCYSITEGRWLWKVKWGGSPGDCNGCDVKVTFTADKSNILAVGVRYIVSYDAKTGELIQKNDEPLDDYSPLTWAKKKGKVFSPSVHYFVTWQEKPIEGHEILGGLFTNDKLTIWNMEKNKRVAYWKKDKPICSATFTPDEKTLVIGTMDGYVRIWDIAARKVIREWKAHWISKDANNMNDIMTVSSISPDGRYLATFGDGAERFNVKIWDYATGALLHEFPDTAFSVKYCGNYPMVFGNDVKYFAFQNWGNVCLYDTQTWTEKWCVPSWPEDNGKKWKYESRPGTFKMIR
jgi:WD40 repeat protein